MESEGYLNFQKFYFCSQEVLQQLRLFRHRVYACRDVGNAAEQIAKAEETAKAKQTNYKS